MHCLIETGNNSIGSSCLIIISIHKCCNEGTVERGRERGGEEEENKYFKIALTVSLSLSPYVSEECKCHQTSLTSEHAWL